MALVGGFEVAGIVSDEPQSLCKKWQAQSGVEKETFLHYFQGAAIVYGILIGRTWQFEPATELKALRRKKGRIPPAAVVPVCRERGVGEAVGLML